MFDFFCVRLNMTSTNRWGGGEGYLYITFTIKKGVGCPDFDVVQFEQALTIQICFLYITFISLCFLKTMRQELNLNEEKLL